MIYSFGLRNDRKGEMVQFAQANQSVGRTFPMRGAERRSALNFESKLFQMRRRRDEFRPSGKIEIGEIVQHRFRTDFDRFEPRTEPNEMFDPRVQRQEQLIDAERELGQWKLKIDRVERRHRVRLEIFGADGKSSQSRQKFQQSDQTIERTRVEFTGQTEIFDRTGAGKFQRDRTKCHAESQRTEPKFWPSENHLTKLTEQMSISRRERTYSHRAEMFGRSVEQRDEIFRQSRSMQCQRDQIRKVEEGRLSGKIHLKKRRKKFEEKIFFDLRFSNFPIANVSLGLVVEVTGEAS